MLKISAETFVRNCVYNTIDKEKMLWLKNKDIGEKLGEKNIYDLIDKEIKGRFETRNPTNEQIREYKRHGSELLDGEKLMYSREDIIMPIIVHWRMSTLEAVEFKTILEFNQHDLIVTKEKSVLTKILKVFAIENICLQPSILSYKIDLYSPEQKLVTEIDKKGDSDRNIDYKIKSKKQ